jgi:hypothetical protein
MNENIFLPDNQMKYTYSTTGDMQTFETQKPVMFAPSLYSQNPTNNTPSNNSPSNTPSNTWLPSAAIFQDDPYYIRNSLLSPNSMKPRVPQKTFPSEKNGLFSSAEGSDPFIPDNRIDDRYSSV